MARELLVALSIIAVGSPVAAQPDSGPLPVNQASLPTTPAPPGTATTRYCMRVELTGNVIEPVRCWTRDQWAEQGVDVDRDWATDGVRVIEA